MGDLLRFESVTQSFQGRIVLKNFSFSLQKGEVIAILGPSGCGKTTILNIAAGLIKQTEGHVHVETEEFGYVFQEPRLLPWKKVIDNVLFVMKKEEKQVMVEKARAALVKVGLEHACELYPKQLSGGMKQRVSIARALVSNPKIILMDEPFSALDVSLKREIQADVVCLLDERDIGVIYVTHDPEEAARIADRVLIFSHGKSGQTQEMVLNVPRNHRTETEILQIRNQLHPFLLGG